MTIFANICIRITYYKSDRIPKVKTNTKHFLTEKQNNTTMLRVNGQIFVVLILIQYAQKSKIKVQHSDKFITQCIK